MERELTLVELYEKGGGGVYPTDKEDNHKYLSTYERLFSPFRYKDVNIFEIGYFYGGSCKLWEDYFPNAQIKAIDITNKYREELPVKLSSRTTLDIKDATTLTREYFSDFPPDIIIDDASHLITDHIITIPILYDVLRPDGIFIIEDVMDIKRYPKVFGRFGIQTEIVDLRDMSGVWDSVLIIARK